MERFWLLGFATIGINGIVMLLVAERTGWPTFRQFLTDPSTAAWIQAIGSIGAILAAVWVVQRQHMLEQARRASERTATQVDRLNGALLVLLSQLNVLLVYRKQILEPERANPARHFSLPATQSLDYPHWIVDWQQFAFLAETTAKDSLMDCMLAHNAFHSATKSINDRVHFHRHDFQLRMETSGLDFSKEVLVADMVAAAGPRITQTLIASTEDVYEQVDTAINHLVKVGDAAPKAFRELFRGHHIIGFAPPESDA